MPEPLVIREDVEGVCWLTLNRPEKLNALSANLFEVLEQHIDDLHSDQSIGCVVLKGAGKCFSAGHDLNDMASDDGAHKSQLWHSQVLSKMETLPKPVIAAVHSHCYTGALEVALAADFIVAADNARFADTHAKWALTPVWGMSQRLPRRVGIATAKKLMFSCETLDAKASLSAGLCEEVYPLQNFRERVAALAKTITDNSWFSHAANKKLLEETDGMELNSGLNWEATNTQGMGGDAKARLQAFLE